MKKKFIITMDEKVAIRMIASGFTLVSNIGKTYIFINKNPANFVFSQDEMNSIAFTDILSL